MTNRKADNPIVVRRATLADMAGVARVYCETWQAAYRGLISDEYLDSLSPARWLARYNGMTALPDTPVQFVALQGSRIVGVCTCGPCRDDGAPPCRGEVYSLYMLPALWGRGGGQRLLGAATAHLKAAGYSQFTLWVLQGNHRAIRFYRAFGLLPDGAVLHTDIGGLPTVEERMYARLPAPGSEA